MRDPEAAGRRGRLVAYFALFEGTGRAGTSTSLPPPPGAQEEEAPGHRRDADATGFRVRGFGVQDGRKWARRRSTAKWTLLRLPSRNSAFRLDLKSPFPRRWSCTTAG
jgi:hypothetical protein